MSHHERKVGGADEDLRNSSFIDYHKLLTAEERKMHAPYYHKLLTNILEGKSTHHLGLSRNTFSIIKVYNDVVSNANKIIQRLTKIRETSSMLRQVASLKEVFPDTDNTADLVIKRVLSLRIWMSWI